MRSYAMPTLLAAGALAVVAVLLALRDSPPASALEFTVTRFDDPEPNGCLPNDCSLREAVIATNDPQIGPDVINLPAGTYMLTRNGVGPSDGEGDLDINDDLAIIGAGAATTVIDASQIDDRIFDFNQYVTPANIENVTLRNGGVAFGDGGLIRNAGVLQLVDVVLENGETNDNGGAIATYGDNLDAYSLALVRTVVRDSEAGQDGGGIFATTELTLTDSTVAHNTAGDEGGGIAATQENPADSASIIRSTVSGNEATFGGGVQLFGGGTLLVTNSTVSGNTASDYSGGINNFGVGEAVLASTTVTENHAGLSGGGLGGDFTIRNTIVSGNSDTGGDPDCYDGVIVSEPANHIGIDGPNCDVSGDTASNTSGDAMLGPLTWNGGFTDAHALLPGSPAIDAGAVAGCTSATGGALGTDQRGGSRHVGPACDIGAYESGAVPPPTPTPVPTPVPTPTPTPRMTSTPAPSVTPTATPGPTVTPAECPEPTPTPTPFHLATRFYACNDLGLPASGIYVEVGNASNKDVVLVAAPGCGESVALTFNHPDFGPEYDWVTVDWGEPCIDPGESLVLKFGVDGPDGQGTVYTHNWLLPATGCPSSTPTPTPTPDPKSFFDTLVTVCNDTGMSASDLHFTFDFLGKGGIGGVRGNPAGCPQPEFSQPQHPFQVDVDWEQGCVDPGESAVLAFRSDCGGCAVNVVDYAWSFPPSPTQVPALQGDVNCSQTVDTVDALGVLRDAAGYDQPQCIAQGDVDCDGDRDSVDALGILRHVAALPPLVQHEPCADIGTPV